MSCLNDQVKHELHKLLERSGKTQSAFADGIGVHPATLSSVLHGQTQISDYFIKALTREYPTILKNDGWRQIMRQYYFIGQFMYGVPEQVAHAANRYHTSDAPGIVIQLCKQHELKFSEFARALNYSHYHVLNVIRGRSAVSREFLLALNSVFGDNIPTFMKSKGEYSDDTKCS